MVLIGPAVSEIEVVEAGEMQVHEEREIRCQNREQKRKLQMMEPLVRRSLREAGRAEGHVRILARHIGEMVMLDIVPMPPRSLMDRRIPGEFLRTETPAPFERVLHSVQHGVADLDRLQLLVDPQRANACQKTDGLNTEMDHRPPDHFHPA